MVGTVNDDSTPPDDSISRIDALALVGGSMGYDEAGAADYLADCARGLWARAASNGPAKMK